MTPGPSGSARSTRPSAPRLRTRSRASWRAGYDAALKGLLDKFATEKPNIATRAASQLTIDALVPASPNLLGGSADLTHSNLTHAKGTTSVKPNGFGGSYIHYGIREFGMAAAMNGIAVHGGFIPYGGTFLVFCDYNRPAIRLAALMGVRVIHVLTHDSIGLGEDGPTHQPVEHVASLRAIPNLLVFRPADAIETALAWDTALKQTSRPSALALSRQNLPALPRDGGANDNPVARGAYVVVDPGKRDVTLMATGSEVSIALEAAKALGEAGIKAAVVSAPCFELFAEQDQAYRDSVLGSAPRVGVEAAIASDWYRWIGDKGEFIGMTGFGASAPAQRAIPRIRHHRGSGGQGGPPRHRTRPGLSQSSDSDNRTDRRSSWPASL